MLVAGQQPVVKGKKKKGPWIGCGVSLRGVLPVGSILLTSALIRSDGHLCLGELPASVDAVYDFDSLRVLSLSCLFCLYG